MTRFHRPIRIALAAVLSLVAASSSAATFSFAIDDTLSLTPPATGPDVLVTGSITTGALGALSASDIVDFAITLTVPGVAEETITPGGATVFEITGDVGIEATETELRITLGQDAFSQVTFVDDRANSYFLIGNPGVGSAIVTAQLFPTSGGFFLGRGLDLGPLPAVQTYARIVDAPAPIPLPPAAFLLLGGLGALGLVKRRRA